MSAKRTLQAIPTWIVAVLSLLICAGLGMTSLFVLAEMQVELFETEIPEMVRIFHRNLPCAIGGVILLGGALAAAAALLRDKMTWRTARIVTAVSAAWLTVLGFVWLGSFQSRPAADQGMLWNLALTLAGQRELDEGTIEYLRNYPFQSASAMMVEPIARLFGSYTAWQVICTFCIGGCVALLCCLCGRMTDSPQAKILCAVLLAGFAPLAMYSTFVYGTLPGMLLALLGIYAVMRQCGGTNREPFWWVLSVISFALSITLYTGEQIFLVAGALVMLAEGLFRQSQWRKILAAALIVILALGFSRGAQALAMHRMGLENEPGMPLLPRIAMGMDSHTSVTPGFYNTDSLVMYAAADYQPAKANELAVDFIKQCWQELREQNRVAAFFGEKTADQWLEPWFGGLTMANPSIYDNPNALAKSMTGGLLFRVLNAWLGTLLPVVYLGAAAGIFLLLRRHPRQVWRLALAAALIGGFIFQLLAETKPRYCLPYYLCCFPLAAAGLAALGQWAAQKRSQRKNSAK